MRESSLVLGGDLLLGRFKWDKNVGDLYVSVGNQKSNVLFNNFNSLGVRNRFYVFFVDGPYLKPSSSIG